ncbi:hypothetical protein [Streptomyces sp. NPDC052042]|uniref:hypothetical protein n=1 Tax=Streptomyces sp. NPDC052042 TaxID=3365683 RepID=UPI0037D65197
MTEETTVFYSLPATKLAAGMSTGDGQDILDVSVLDDSVFATVYTPRSDDPVQDAINRANTETRIYQADQTVGLAVFADTALNGQHLTDRTSHDSSR